MKLNYILPLLKSVLLMSVILMLVYNNANVIKAETNGQETVTDTSGWSDYDYKDIDKILKESSYNSVTFEDIVDSIYLGNSTRDSGKKIVQYITEVISSNRNDCMKILILCILSAFINVFGPFFNKQQLTESTLSVIAISLITVLFVVFIQASDTASSTLTSIINLYKAISMVFLPAISASGAIMSKAVYYQIIIAMIAVSNIFFKNILLKTNKIYLPYTIVYTIITFIICVLSGCKYIFIPRIPFFHCIIIPFFILQCVIFRDCTCNRMIRVLYMLNTCLSHNFVM